MIFIIGIALMLIWLVLLSEKRLDEKYGLHFRITPKNPPPPLD